MVKSTPPLTPPNQGFFTPSWKAPARLGYSLFFCVASCVLCLLMLRSPLFRQLLMPPHPSPHSLTDYLACSRSAATASPFSVFPAFMTSHARRLCFPPEDASSCFSSSLSFYCSLYFFFLLYPPPVFVLTLSRIPTLFPRPHVTYWDVKSLPRRPVQCTVTRPLHDVSNIA